MINPDPKLRPNMQEVINSNWFVEMEKLTYYQVRQPLMNEEFVWMDIIEQMQRIRFSSTVGRVIYFYISEQFFDQNTLLNVGRMYMLIDRNANGDIDKYELSKFMIKYYDKADIRYKADKIFSNIDVDESGTIEFSEFKVCSLSFKFEEIIMKMKRL